MSLRVHYRGFIERMEFHADRILGIMKDELRSISNKKRVATEATKDLQLTYRMMTMESIDRSMSHRNVPFITDKLASFSANILEIMDTLFVPEPLDENDVKRVAKQCEELLEKLKAETENDTTSRNRVSLHGIFLDFNFLS